MGDTKPSTNNLHEVKHTRGSVLSFRVGLDPVATSYPIGWIKRIRNISLSLDLI